MLKITIPATPNMELFDESTSTFTEVEGSPEVTLQLEHSLLSLSKWESKWCKPFLSKDKMTTEETLDYIRCMTVTQNVKPEVYDHITDENIMAVIDYIKAPMTATWFSKNAQEGGTSNNKEVLTAELLYYYMIAYSIPFECQKWHLNRLITLIKVCGIKNAPPKKMSKSDALNQRKALNAARRASLNTKG